MKDGRLTDAAFRQDLEDTIGMIVDAVGGEDACEAVGYRLLQEADRAGTREHRFWVLVRNNVKGAIVGRAGKNADRIRELVRTRATVLGNHEPIDVRVIGDMSEAPEGVFA